MDRAEDPFIALAAEALVDDFDALQRRPLSGEHAGALELTPAGTAIAPAIGRLHGFDLLDQPVLSGLPGCDGELLPARTTVPLRQAAIGQEVLVLFEQGNPRAPIIIGVVAANAFARASEPATPAGVSIQVDGERHVVQAEREIVLRCGEASITLTRAGKVIIEGNYILSRSKGYNKIKGAAVDIN